MQVEQSTTDTPAASAAVYKREVPSYPLEPALPACPQTRVPDHVVAKFHTCPTDEGPLWGMKGDE